MTIQEIKNAVDKGHIVHRINESYRVIKDNKNKYLIKRKNFTIGLQWEDGTLNGQESEFFIKDK